MKSDYEAIKDYLEAKGYGENEAHKLAVKGLEEIEIIRSHSVQSMDVPAGMDEGGLLKP